jgi:hydroxymethylpyrimidine/phosphomethylpyrimidine kinase
VVTPNLPEALILSGRKSRQQRIENVADMQDCCREISRLGARNVLLKGGHILISSGMVTDMLYQDATDSFQTFNHP